MYLHVYVRECAQLWPVFAKSVFCMIGKSTSTCKPDPWPQEERLWHIRLSQGTWRTRLSSVFVISINHNPFRFPYVSGTVAIIYFMSSLLLLQSFFWLLTILPLAYVSYHIHHYLNLERVWITKQSHTKIDEFCSEICTEYRNLSSVLQLYPTLVTFRLFAS